MAAPTLRRKHASARRDVIFTALAGLICAGLIFLAPYLAQGRDADTTRDSQKDRSAQVASLKGLPATDLTEDEAIVHTLNRLGYGPRPGDVQRVKEMGLAKWTERQLHPESINDSGLDARLSRFSTLSMSSEALLERFPRPAVAAKREGISPQEYRKQQQEKRQAAQAAQQSAESQQSADSQPEPMAEQASDGASGQPNN